MKTISSRVLEYKESEFKNDKRFAISYEQQIICCVNDFKAGVDFAQRWILFENERPPQFEQVLVKCKGKGDKIYLSEYLGYGNGSFTDTSSTVTHWRRIELK